MITHTPLVSSSLPLVDGLTLQGSLFMIVMIHFYGRCVLLSTARWKGSGQHRTKFRCTDPLGGPDIAIGEQGLSLEKPITVAEMMKRTVSKIPNCIGLRYKTGNSWNNVTYQEYYYMCISAAKSFIKVINMYKCI